MPVHPLPARKSSPIAGGRTRDMRRRLSIILLAMLQRWSAAAADATISVDFTKTNHNVTLHHGLTVITGRFGAALEVKSPLQLAELPFTS